MSDLETIMVLTLTMTNLAVLYFYVQRLKNRDR